MPRGRPPKPAEQKLREGNPGKRKVETTVVAGRSIPDAPPHLMPEDREAWDIIIEDLSESGILDRADRLVVEAVAVAVGRARQAREAMAAERAQAAEDAPGAHLLSYGARGVQKNPLVAVEREAWATVLSGADRLGLGPTGRARLGIAAKTKRTVQDEMGAKLGDSPRRLRAVEGGKAP